MKKKKERNVKEMRQILKLYHESFLRRLLRYLDVFTSVAALEWSTNSETLQNKEGSAVLALLKKVAAPEHIAVLLSLLVYSSPRSKMIVLRILESLIKVQWSAEIFEQAT